VVVVQVDEDRGQAERLLAPVTARAAADRPFEAIEKPLQVLGRTDAAGLSAQDALRPR
jgi:hypothetical protein